MWRGGPLPHPYDPAWHWHQAVPGLMKTHEGWPGLEGTGTLASVVHTGDQRSATSDPEQLSSGPSRA